MLGLTGPAWMLLSIALCALAAFVIDPPPTDDLIESPEDLLEAEPTLTRNAFGCFLFHTSRFAMIVYAIIGIFLGPKWYTTLWFAFLGVASAVTCMGVMAITNTVIEVTRKRSTEPVRILPEHQAREIKIRSFIFFIVLPILQTTAAVFAYVAWF